MPIESSSTAVAPDPRRKGMGTRLVKEGVAAARELHALHHPAVRLVVDVHEPENIAELLCAQGFAPVSYHSHMEHRLDESIHDIPIRPS